MNTEQAIEQLKLTGLDQAAKHYRPDFLRAQAIADLLGMVMPVVTADDVREAFLEKYQRELKIGNAMGKLFFDKKKWEYAGHVKSKRGAARGRWLFQWRRVDKQAKSDVQSI